MVLVILSTMFSALIVDSTFAACEWKQSEALTNIAPPDTSYEPQDLLEGKTCQELCESSPKGCSSFVTNGERRCFLNAHLGYERGALKDAASRLYFVEKVCDDEPLLSDMINRCELKDITSSFSHSDEVDKSTKYTVAGYTISARNSSHCREVCWGLIQRGTGPCVAFAVAPYWKGEREYWRGKHAERCLVYGSMPPIVAGDLTLRHIACVDKDGAPVDPQPEFDVVAPLTTPPPTQPPTDAPTTAQTEATTQQITTQQAAPETTEALTTQAPDTTAAPQPTQPLATDAPTPAPTPAPTQKPESPKAPTMAPTGPPAVTVPSAATNPIGDAFIEITPDPRCGYLRVRRVDQAAGMAAGLPLSGMIQRPKEQRKMLEHCAELCHTRFNTKEGCQGWFITTDFRCYIIRKTTEVTAIPSSDDGVFFWEWRCPYDPSDLDVVVTPPPVVTDASTTAAPTPTPAPTPPPATPPPPPATDGYPLVQLGPGKVQGAIVDFDGTEYGVFKGIPYAKPPLDGLRMQPTEEVEPWDGTLDGTREDYPVCHQFFAPHLELPQSEDCLTLDVYTPKADNDDTELRPVLVFVHGGSFIVGSSRDFKAEGFLRSLASQGLVVVVVQYRLGPLGFYHNKGAGYHGNYGLLDVAEALAFVSREAAHFGGDKDSVTIMGESAGATAVLLLNSSPKMKEDPKFHRAIVMSAPYHSQPMGPPAWFPLQLTGILCEDAAQCDLSAVPLKDIVQASFAAMMSLGRAGAVFMWGPTVDGELVTKMDDWAELSVADAVLLGTTKDEMLFYVNASAPPPPADHYPEIIEKELEFLGGGFHNSEVIKTALYAKYAEMGLSKFSAEEDDDERALKWTMLHQQMGGTAIFFANAWIQAVQLEKLDVPVYFYSFDYVSEGFGDAWYKGAAHVYDLAILFGGLNEKHLTTISRAQLMIVEEEDLEMSKMFGLLLANFAKEANPTPAPVDGFTWTAFESDEYNFAKIHKTTEMANGYHPDDVPFYVHFVLKLGWMDGKCTSAQPYVDRSKDFDERKEQVCMAYCSP